MRPKRGERKGENEAHELTDEDRFLCQSLLTAHPTFGTLSPDALDRVLRSCWVRTFAAEEVLVREGEAGDAFYLIADGVAEVTAVVSDGEGSRTACLASLGPGDHLGEIALLTPDRLRTATARAVTALRAFVISSGGFQGLVERHPEIERQLAAAADASLVVKFMKQASPFARLDPDALGDLAAKLRPLSVEPGTAVVRQGEEGDCCYLLRSGAMEVVAETREGALRNLAKLEAGAVFGEIGLLVGALRNATVRATEPSELLVLSRADYLAVVPEHASLDSAMFELTELRRRPRRAAPVTEHRRPTSEGDSVIVLRHEEQHRYYQLSGQGLFVWQRLDGDTTLKDLTIDFFRTHQEFAPDKIGQIIAGLAHAGFVEDAAPRPVADRPASNWDAALSRARQLLEWRVTLHNVDRAFDMLYRFGGFVLFLRPVQIMLAVLCVIGLVAAALSAPSAVQTVSQSSPLILVWLIPFVILTAVLHEIGHGLAVKHAGRVVRGAGLGWYWFGPMVFIDTTDIWLSSRRERVAVSLAGPAVDAVVGSLAAIVAWFSSDLTQLIALQLAVVSYISVLANLNPLLEYDGYHILVDLLERPGLRRRSLQWLRQVVGERRFTRADLARHRVELFFAVGSVVYIVVMIALTVTVFRLTVGEWLQSVLTSGQAEILAWLAALLIAFAATAGIWHDLRRPAPAKGS